jgi:hypothetical protein
MNEYKSNIKLINRIIRDVRVHMKEEEHNEAVKGADKHMIKYLQAWKDILKDEKRSK